MISLINIHTTNTVTKPDTAGADSQYGTIENLLECHDRGINAHMPAVKTRNKTTGSRKDIYPEERFIYDKNTEPSPVLPGKYAQRGLSIHTGTTQNIWQEGKIAGTVNSVLNVPGIVIHGLFNVISEKKS
jgi:hypothetical protein